MIYKKEKATRTLIGGSLMALVGVAMVVYNGSFVLKISPLGEDVYKRQIFKNPKG